MRSIRQLLCVVIDGEINTPEQGAALLDEEAKDYAAALKIPELEARAQLLANIEDSSIRLCPRQQAERLKEVYGFHLPPLQHDELPSQG